MKKIATFIFIIVSFHPAFCQNVFDLYSEVCFYQTGGNPNFCAGDSIELYVFHATLEPNSNCQYGLRMASFDEFCGQQCINIDHASLNIEYNGGSLSSHSVIPTYFGSNCPHPSGTITFDVVPYVSDTLKVSWTVVLFEEFCDGTTQTINHHYQGSIFLDPQLYPVPILSSDTLIYIVGDTIELKINGGESGVLYAVKDDCMPFDSLTYINIQDTSTIVYKFVAPSYRKRIDYQVIFDVDQFCPNGLIYSNILSIQVEDTITNESCNNPYPDIIESILNDSSSTSNSSYHFYTVFDTVCTSQNSECNLGEVWNHMKSDIRYQVPSQFGLLTNNELSSIGSRYNFFEGEEPLPAEIPLINCTTINIETNILRFMIKPLIYATSIVSLGELNLCGKDFNLTHDPIIIVVDEESYCITNYTLPGHVLFPGKVTRCLTENCEAVYISTIGVGMHLCGNSPEGYGFGQLNEFIGPKLFIEVNEKLKGEF